MMRKLAVAAAAVLLPGLLFAPTALLRAADTLGVPWAYAVAPAPVDGAPRPAPVRPPDGPLTLPGSDATMPRQQISDGFNAADWWPNDHPSMPPIVKNGRKPAVRPCGLCPYPNRKGKPN